jgi:hypothetical protein
MVNFMLTGGHSELKSVFSLHLIYQESELVYESTMLPECEVGAALVKICDSKMYYSNISSKNIPLLLVIFFKKIQ